MDKLGIVGSNYIPHPGKKPDKKVEKEKKSRAVSFKHRLDNERDESEIALNGMTHILDGSETVEGLLDDVNQLGEALKKDATLAALKRYKSSVKRFYKYVVDHSLEADRVTGRLNPRTMSRKQYTLIAIIDDKLERLGACVLQNQKDQLDILKKVDELYGILIDLKR